MRIRSNCSAQALEEVAAHEGHVDPVLARRIAALRPGAYAEMDQSVQKTAEMLHLCAVQ